LLLIHRYEILASTNDEAKRLIGEGAAAHGTTVTADSQTGGRGRAGRVFVSPAGGLYMSVVIAGCQGDGGIDSPALLTVAAGVAVTRALEDALSIETGIKWVNDIIYKGKKVGGILAETYGGFAVVGIGLNLRTESLSPELPEAGSLLDVAGELKPYELAEVVRDRLLELCDNFDKPAVIGEYRRKSVLLGKPVTVFAGDNSCDAVAVGIGADGELIISLPDGTRQALTYGEVRVRQVL